MDLTGFPGGMCGLWVFIWGTGGLRCFAERNVSRCADPAFISLKLTLI